MANSEVLELKVQRWSIRSSRPIGAIVAALEAAIGHPNMVTFSQETGSAQNLAELQSVVEKGLGRSGLMEFARYDLGAILKKESPKAPASFRLVIGNPLIMKELVKHVPDAGSYAPVTVLVDERAGGVQLSYDRMASFLSVYGDPDALEVARALDAKVEALLTEVAR